MNNRSYSFIFYRAIFLIVVLLSPVCSLLKAQNPTDADIKTALIYNFLRYVSPSADHKNSSDTLKVGVYGEDKYLTAKLKSLQDEKVRGKKIVVRKLTKIDTTEDIDLLFILYEYNFEISPIYRLIKGTNILLVSDRYDNKQEVMINFIHDPDNKIKFEINTKNIQDAGLVISPKLLLLGGTELDIRELYKKTEKSLITERERAEQIENELNSKKQEIKILTRQMNEMHTQIDTLNSIIISNIFHIQKQEKNLDSLNNEQTRLSEEAIQRKNELDSTNLSLYNKNAEIHNLDVFLAKKQENLEEANNQLLRLTNKISDTEIVLDRQNMKISSQRTILMVFFAFILLLTAFLFYIYRNYKLKQARNIELERRNHQINLQNEKIQAQAKQLKATNLELAKLSIVAEKINNAVIIMDDKGNIEWVNEGFVRMFGYTYDEFIEKSGDNFLTSSSNQNPGQLFDTCIKGKKAISYNSEIITKNKERKWLHSTITPVLDKNNEIVKLVAIDTDISLLKEAENNILQKNMEIEENTKRLILQASDLTKANHELEIQKKRAEDALIKLKNAQSQLVANEKMASLGQLTSGIAHEINNPISYISSSIEGLRYILSDIKVLLGKYEELNLEKDYPGISQIKNEIEYDELLSGFDKLTSNIKMGVDRTKEIVNSLRTFSRIDEDNFSLVDINESIDSTIVLVGKQYKNRITIKRNFNSLPKIEGIAGKLNQVFLNIIVNAVQSIKKEGKIVISTSVEQKNEKDFVRIEIKDNGIGMSKETREKIFEPFFTTKDVGEGTGLGLSITYSILKKHKGWINVESQLKNGTTFIIYLPVRRN